MDQNKAWGNKQANNVLAGFKYFNTVLSNAPYVAGDVFTMADITLFAGLAFADFGKLTVPSQYTHLLTWRAKIQDRPSLK
ncbi:MAG: glutathione S-transferase [Psychromonas sp.]